ncbi:hypothetical protein D0Z07_9342 [Hyphodiscus hymeniophilus]|uniref:Serine-threonine/tyrosine-protein kinase catalytic domain-containing protein n=1 Tax=Hyphodiscus hymeniophilus TaxID=353542 RepID=A0A9P6VDF6_9HELO|nr:hypothetical protein D0Z07_9342 [Hyphodiscus hymeniophilus]
MGPSDRPLTQINMLPLAGTKSPTKVTERAVLFDSLNSRSIPKGDALSKKRARPPADTPDATTGRFKAPSRMVRSATSGPLQLRAAWESPWGEYEKVYDVELGGTVEVAVRKAPPVELVHVRAFSTEASEKTLYLHMPVSLERIVRSPAYPDERQLVAILGQVVAGVAYLAAEGFEHGSLTCSNILLNIDGDVKIGEQSLLQIKNIVK